MPLRVHSTESLPGPVEDRCPAWGRRASRTSRSGCTGRAIFDTICPGRRQSGKPNTNTQTSATQVRITLITDAWHPQVNGIVTTIEALDQALTAHGHEVQVIGPDRFDTWPCPGYPDAGLAFLCGPRLRPLIRSFAPAAIHLLTEGPIGYAARRYCRHDRISYTSSFHSYFPEYLHLRIGLPLAIGYAYLKWFHRRSARVMVNSESLQLRLRQLGFHRLTRWPLGVDTDLFRPGDKGAIRDQRPVFMYVGRLAIEKNVEDFLRLELPGSRYVVGDGPQRQDLQRRYGNAHFLGYQQGLRLAEVLASADVLVFPSRTDTFGLVMLEALACGVPVAAYPVRGPLDVIRDPRVGALDFDLRTAALAALKCEPTRCRRCALDWSWESSARSFAKQLVPADLA